MYLNLLRQLLPHKVYSEDDTSIHIKDLTVHASALGICDINSNDLKTELFPDRTDALLDGWERMAGLPWSCFAGQAQTKEERRTRLVAQLTMLGGQSRQFFIDLAAFLGKTITITEYSSFRAGHSSAADPCCDNDWIFAWSINHPDVSFSYFAAGGSSAGDYLRTHAGPLELFYLGKYSPAHTLLLYNGE